MLRAETAKDRVAAKRLGLVLVLLYGTAFALDMVGHFNQPHDDRGLWAWLELASLLLGVTGFGIMFRAVWARRAVSRTGS